MKLLLNLLFATLTAYSFACDCKTISKEKDYQLSDRIFLGQITDVYEDYFEVRIIESFKGDESESIRIFLGDYCSVLPKRSELWLMYSKKEKDGKFYVSHCGWSRSFSHPFSINSENLPAPPPAGEIPDYALSISETNKALYELQQDILNLRNVREQQKVNNKKNLYYGVLFISSVLGLLIFSLCKWKKKSI